ncbi:MAG TPA: methyltransferase domain-containing protein [Opitutaceae bacterium]|nr:methyltransferase domain-containing protein [Opitutaceae bacterium]
METIASSSAHLALIAQRRADLRAALAPVLPSAARFLCEIGSGHGHFLTACAAAHPGELCIGIDLVGERVARAIRKRDRAKLPNLHFFHAEAHDFLAALPADASFSAIVILFPDPWPKRRHHKNRLLQPAFLDALAARAGQGTRLYFRTDHRDYFAQATSVLAAHPAWRIDPAAPWLFETETVFQARAPAYHSWVAERLAGP